MSQKAKAVIAVGTKRTREYVLSCLSLFNRGIDEVELVGVGETISKAAEVSRIIAGNFTAEPATGNVLQLQRGDDVFTSSSLRVRFHGSTGLKTERSTNAQESGYVSFASYHLLTDHLLKEQGPLYLGTDGYRRLLKISATESGFNCSRGEDLDQLLLKPFREEDHGGSKREGNPAERLTTALYRAGYLLSANWEQIASKLGQYDDIVLGLDTNILYDCLITQQLLDALAFYCPPRAAPNWILLVVPNTVMHEIEQAANSRNQGTLSKTGRAGYRALEEILELDQSRDIRGVSLLIVGDTDPVLDARVEIRGLREDLKTIQDGMERRWWEERQDGERPSQRMKSSSQSAVSVKMSVGDTLIRDQFKSFLRQLNFHKGTFFLTADKSNCALGQAEGLHSIYCQKAHWRQAIQRSENLPHPYVDYQGERLMLTVPLGKIIYELAVEFGSALVSANGDSVRFSCDTRGDSLEHWISRRLWIEGRDLAKLMARYQQSARVPLDVAEAFWETDPKGIFF